VTVPVIVSCEKADLNETSSNKSKKKVFIL
jgi:hypothetical protein